MDIFTGSLISQKKSRRPSPSRLQNGCCVPSRIILHKHLPLKHHNKLHIQPPNLALLPIHHLLPIQTQFSCNIRLDHFFRLENTNELLYFVHPKLLLHNLHQHLSLTPSCWHCRRTLLFRNEHTKVLHSYHTASGQERSCDVQLQ